MSIWFAAETVAHVHAVLVVVPPPHELSFRACQSVAAPVVVHQPSFRPH